MVMSRHCPVSVSPSGKENLLHLSARTVREEIAYGVKNLGIEHGKEVIDSALVDAGLTESADLYPRWLSRGERQRLGIACVVAMQPSIIVLDEPTTGLDGAEAHPALK